MWTQLAILGEKERGRYSTARQGRAENPERKFHLATEATARVFDKGSDCSSALTKGRQHLQFNFLTSSIEESSIFSSTFRQIIRTTSSRAELIEYRWSILYLLTFIRGASQ